MALSSGPGALGGRCPSALPRASTHSGAGFGEKHGGGRVARRMSLLHPRLCHIQAPWQTVPCKNDTVTLTEADELDVYL